MQLVSVPSATDAVSAGPPTGFRRSNFRRLGTILLFLTPSAILYIVFVFLPVIQAAYYSLFSWDGLGPLDTFVGLKNYLHALQDKVFLASLGHNIEIVVLSLLIQLPFALTIALIIGKKLPGRTFFRTIFFLPFILSDVVTAVIWSFMYRPDGGLINTTLQQLIHGYQGPLWLADPNIVLACIFVVMTWKYFGFHMVLYVAGIQNIPDELVEASRIDGATNMQVVRNIYLPLLSSTIGISVFFSILGALQYFDLIYVMTGGGPVHASETMATYLVTYGFKTFSIGYGNAIGVIMFLLCFVFALFYQRLIMGRELAGGVSDARA
jgi:raffinose/stachyose/melibiose transport system permease protein